VFENNRLMIFAPTAEAAMFTTINSVGKILMYNLKIPTPRFGIFDKKQMALDYLKNSRMPVVEKTDGHKPSNAVMVCPSETIARAYIEDCFFSGETKVLIEDYVPGTAFSFYVITDGYHALPIGSVVDYKFALDGDGGVLTKGMGAYAPCIRLTLDQEAYIMRDIVSPILKTLADQQKHYMGIVGFDGILTSDGYISIIECNSFLRDHDAQAVLSLVDEDIYKVMEACVVGAFSDDYHTIDLKDEFAVSIVLSSGKYKNTIINGLDDLDDETIVSHLNTKKNEYLEYEALGDRALILTKTAKTLARAKSNLCEEIDYISFDGKHYRKDLCAFID